jgi:hypothetical protein
MKTTLYNIEQQYLDIVSIIELMGGEITPEQEKALEINEKELKTKSLNYKSIIDVKESLNSQIDNEIKRLQAIKKSNTNIIDRLKNNLLGAINLFGDIETQFNKFTTRRSERLIIDDSISEIPKEFITKVVTEKVDKTELKKAINNGLKVKGVSVESINNLSIK